MRAAPFETSIILACGRNPDALVVAVDELLRMRILDDSHQHVVEAGAEALDADLLGRRFDLWRLDILAAGHLSVGNLAR